MKNVFYFLVLTAFTVFSSCSKDDTVPSEYSVDGTKYSLNVGTIEDTEDTDDALTYRMYDLEFKNSEVNPTAYLKFRMYSPNTTRLQEGTYEYTYTGYAKNKFSYVKFAHSLVYDSKGVVTSGKIYSENDYIIVGTITVGKSGSIYTFDLDFTATDEDDASKKYTIKGHFEEVLTDGYVILGK